MPGSHEVEGSNPSRSTNPFNNLLILRLSLEPLLPETRCVATKVLLNMFPNDSETNAQLVSLRSQCAGFMTLNPLAGADFIKCFDQWKPDERLRWPSPVMKMGASMGGPRRLKV